MKLKKFNFNKVKSTNNTAIRLIKKGNDYGIVSSESQSNGKGQRGNKWISKKGNLFISIFFKINEKLIFDKIVKLNLIIVNKIINSFISVKTNIKSPNDILIKKKKVCGILQETLFKDENRFLIIGMGINVLNSPKIKNYPTAFLNNYSKKNIHKQQLAKKIKLEFEKNYYKFCK